MTLPDMPGGTSLDFGLLDDLFGVSAGGEIPARVSLTQPAVESSLKQTEIQESPGWQSANDIGFFGLIPGVPLVANILMTAANAILGLPFSIWPGTGPDGFLGEIPNVLSDIGNFFFNLTGFFGGGVDFNSLLFDIPEAIFNFVDTMILPTDLLAQLIGGFIPGFQIPGLDASKIISGTFPMDMIAGLLDILDNIPVIGPFVGMIENLGFIPTSLLGGGGTQNVLKNPVFETDLSFWHGVTGAGVNGGDAATWDGTAGHDNMGSLRFTAPSQTSYAYSEAIPVTPGQKIAASAWLKWSGVTNTSSAFADIGVSFFADGGGHISDLGQVNTFLTTASGGWLQTTTGDITAPANAKTAQMWVEARQTPGSVWFDDASVTKSGFIIDSLVPGLGGIIDTLISAFSGGGNGLSGLLAAAQAIPGVNIATTLLASVIPGLDVSKIVSGVFGTGLIPGLDVSKIISGVFGGGFIPGLDASKIISGAFPLSMITGLLDTGGKVVTSLLSVPTSVITGLFSGSSILTSWIPGLDTSKIVSGSFPVSMITGLLSGGGTILTSLLSVPTSVITGVLGAGNIPGIDASKLVSGVISSAISGVGAFADALFGGFGGSGSGVTNTQVADAAAVVTQNASDALASAISAQTTLQTQQGTVPPGGINVTYSFSGADNTLLSATDFTTGPTSGDIRYVGNNGYIGIRSGTGDGFYWMRANTQFATDEQSVAVVLGDSYSTNPTTLLLRSDSALAAGAYCHVTYQGIWIGYYTFSGGTWTMTQLASVSTPTNTGQRVEFRCFGLNYYVLVNGVQVLTVTDSGNHVTRDASHRYAGGRWMQTSDFFGIYQSYRLAALVLSDFAGVGVSTTTSWRLSRSNSGNVALGVANGGAAAIPAGFFTAQDYATNATVTTLGTGVITIITAGWYELTASLISLVSSVSSSVWVTAPWAPYVNGAQATGPIPCGSPVSVFLNAGDTVQPGVVAAGPTQSNTGSQTANSVAAGTPFAISNVAGYASWTGKFEAAA